MWTGEQTGGTSESMWTQLRCVITSPTGHSPSTPAGARRTGRTSTPPSVRRFRYKWRIRSELHSPADAADPLWSSGSQQFNSTEPMFVKCLGPLDQSEGTLIWFLSSVRRLCGALYFGSDPAAEPQVGWKDPDWTDSSSDSVLLTL